MRNSPSVWLLLLSPLGACAGEPARPQNAGTLTAGFQADSPGSFPSGFQSLRTGGGRPGNWVIRKDPQQPTNLVLAQDDADPEEGRFPLCVVGGLELQWGWIGVRFRNVSGSVDRAAGLVVRLSDENNYYVLRANALEDNVRFYRVVAGQREQLASADVRISDRVWHNLRLEYKGPLFLAYLDGVRLFQVEDGTFTRPGRVGLWTKADSVTWFDDLEVLLPFEGTTLEGRPLGS